MYRNRDNQFNQQNRDDRDRVNDKINQYNINISLINQNNIENCFQREFQNRSFQKQNNYYSNYINQNQYYSSFNQQTYQNQHQSKNQFSNVSKIVASLFQRLINKLTRFTSNDQQNEYDFKFVNDFKLVDNRFYQIVNR